MKKTPRNSKRARKMTILLLVLAMLVGNTHLVYAESTNNKDNYEINDNNQNETIIVTGIFHDTSNHPLVNYSVEVYNSVPGGDELLAKCFTDKNGSFSINVPPPDVIPEGIFLGLFGGLDSFSGCYYNIEIPSNISVKDLGVAYVNVKRSPLPSSGNSVTIYGTFEYEYEDGSNHPVRNAYGNVWDDILGGLDNILAYFHTDDNGYFCVNIKEPFIGVYDIYAKVYSTEGVDGEVGVSDSLGFTYRIKTNTIHNVGAGQTKNLQTNSPDSTKENKAFHILEVMQRAHDLAEDQGGVNMGGVSCNFPAVWDQYDYYTNNIHILKDSGFWTYRIAHEYGHAVMDAAYGELDAGPGWPWNVKSDHWFYSEYNSQHAIVEGWAQYFGFMIENEIENGLHDVRGEWGDFGWYEYHRGDDDRHDYDDGDSWNKPGTIHHDPPREKDDWDGNKVEGSVMKILYDLWDDTPDETINGIDLDGNEWDQYEDFLGKDSINLNFGDIIDVLDTEPDSIMDMYPYFANKVEEHHLRSLYFNNGIRDFDDDGNLWENQHAPTLDSISPGGGTYGGWIGDVDEQCSELLYSSESIYLIRLEQEEC